MLLLIAAVPFETAVLRSNITNCRSESLGSTEVLSGVLYAQNVILAHSGIGQAAMALQLTRILENHHVEAVLLCGCAGSYPGSQLSNGDLVIASEEVFGDTGVATVERFIPAAQLDIPQDPKQILPCHERYPLQSPLSDLARRLLPAARFGPCVTVSSCSGHQPLSLQLEQRTGGICENMEGAAAAQVCAEYRIPLLELRGISNPTGTRDAQLWELKKGSKSAQLGILKLVENWPEAFSPC